MSTVTVNPSASGTGLKRISLAQLILGGAAGALDLSAVASATANFATASSAQSMSSSFDEIKLKAGMSNSYTLAGVRFSQGGKDYLVKASGVVQTDVNPATGNGTNVGTLTAAQGELTLTAWPAGSSPTVTNWRAIAGAAISGDDTPYKSYGVSFRTAAAPLRPSGFSVTGTMADGSAINVTADANGVVNSTRVKGRVDYTTGVVRLVFVTPTPAAGIDPVDLSYLGIAGLTTAYVDLVQQETLRYNAVAYTYLSIDAELLGLNPVRLPTDGRVPIFRAAGVVVVGRTLTTAPATATNGDTVDTGQERLSRVRVVGADGNTINTGYTADLESGVVTWVDVTGYSQPVHVEYRFEDMALVRQADIDGRLTLMRPLTHSYAADGKTFVSSALVYGDLQARVENVFDQYTGTAFDDVLIGDPATGTYNNIDYPIVTTNRGCVGERWMLKFTSTTGGNIIGEHLGVIGTFTTGAVCAPINQATGEPYFTLDPAGWGLGWVNGNLLRFNTIGAQGPVWVARTIKQGAEGDGDYSFTLLARGDVDNEG